MIGVDADVARKEADGGFGAIAAAVAAATVSAGAQIYRLPIIFAGQLVELVVVGDELSDCVFPAFAHLESAAADRPCRSIVFLDAEATGTPPLRPPSGGEWVSEGEGWRVSVHGASRYLSEARPNSLICLDRDTGSVAAFFLTAGGMSLADRARPLQRMMKPICTSFCVQDVHAALVACGGTGVLIVGGSGSGKTTTSIDCLAHGLDFLGDDTVAIGEGPPGTGFTGYSLYNSARVLPSQLGRWPALVGKWDLPGPQDDKALLLAAKLAGARVVRQCRIAAILIPRVAGGAFRLSPVSPRLAFSALVHDSEKDRRFRLTSTEFRQLASLTRETPCFLCELDVDPAAVAFGVNSLIEDLAA